MTSWISTSRLVPLNVTPTRGPLSESRVGIDVDRVLDVEERRAPAIRTAAPSRTDRGGCSAARPPSCGTRRRRDPRCRCLPSPRRPNRRRSSSAPRPSPSSACERYADAIAELEEREPAMADLLPEHAQRVVLAQELLRGIVGILADPVHHRQAAQPAAAAEVAGRVVDLDADAADLVGDGGLVGEGVAERWRRRSRTPAGRSCPGGSGRTCASGRPDRAGSRPRTARRPPRCRR